MKTLSISALLASLALSATFATAQDITPTRVGPVSQYGQLMTGKTKVLKMVPKFRCAV